MPVFAKDVVATSQPLAAMAGLRMLQQGGNAIDAAVATAITLTVVEPTSNGIGADGFALIWAGGGLHGLNASGHSPMAMTPERYAGQEKISTRGWDGVTVPGAVSGWVESSRKFGALPFGKLFEPAIEYAREGFLLSPWTGGSWRRAHRAYEGFDSWQETFCPKGRAPEIGELVRLPDHAETLEKIAATEGEAFYRGDLAERIAGHAKETGGLITMEDMARHEPEWVRPISTEYHGYSLQEIPPNGQGLVALIALGIMRHIRGLEDLPVDSADSVHLQIEAMKLAFRDGHRYIADPRFMDVSPESLLRDDYLADRAKLIDKRKARDPGHGTPKPGGTVYLTTADREGNMVSYIQSNYTGFGSGIVVPGTGIGLQNRGCCFTLEKGHPNEVGPGKRPYHTIIPGFLTKKIGRVEEPVMSFGVMGGFMQPQGHAQVVHRMVVQGQNPRKPQNPQAAIDAPRWQVMGGLKVNYEPVGDDFEPGLYEDLRKRGHDLTIAGARTALHGRGQAIWRLEEGYVAASDGRADGMAVGI